MVDALNGKPAIAGTDVLEPDHLLAAGSVAIGLCGEISSATIFASAPSEKRTSIASGGHKRAP